MRSPCSDQQGSISPCVGLVGRSTSEARTIGANGLARGATAGAGGGAGGDNEEAGPT